MKTGFYVRDVMTKRAIAIDGQESVETAAKLMRKEDIGSVTILIEERIVGIITHEDIVHRVVANGLDASTIPCRNVMTTPVVSIGPQLDIFDAIVHMNKNKVRQLPVIDTHGELKGYLTLKDILRVEPELLEIATDVLSIREEHEKPVSKRHIAGNCESCGETSEELLEIRDVLLCPFCRGALRPLMD